MPIEIKTTSPLYYPEDVVSQMIQEAVAAEREACAKIADVHEDDSNALSGTQWADGWAAASRSMGYDIRNRK